jgi:hypothetical protein
MLGVDRQQDGVELSDLQLYYLVIFNSNVVDLTNNSIA